MDINSPTEALLIILWVVFLILNTALIIARYFSYKKHIIQIGNKNMEENTSADSLIVILWFFVVAIHTTFIIERYF